MAMTEQMRLLAQLSRSQAGRRYADPSRGGPPTMQDPERNIRLVHAQKVLALRTDLLEHAQQLNAQAKAEGEQYLAVPLVQMVPLLIDVATAERNLALVLMGIVPEA